jgi:hypothetical protein
MNGNFNACWVRPKNYALTGQGSAPVGCGARDHLAAGELTGGVALMAYPATYRASGIMAFSVTQDGNV